MDNIHIAGTGIWHPEEMITNDEIVESYNSYVDNFNYKNADVLIDKTSIELIKGSKIDYVNELIGSSFKISNPLASSSCGCGTSFSI